MRLGRCNGAMWLTPCTPQRCTSSRWLRLQTSTWQARDSVELLLLLLLLLFDKISKIIGKTPQIACCMRATARREAFTFAAGSS